jgi:hypothetical protein
MTMNTEWTEETVLPYMFKEVEVRDRDGSWGVGKLTGYRHDAQHKFYSGRFSFEEMRPIPEKKTRLMTPEELWGKALLSVGGNWHKIGEMDYRGYQFWVPTMKSIGSVTMVSIDQSFRGWADHPGAEFHEGFEAEV